LTTTLKANSIISEKGCNPFFDEQCQERQSNLFLPTKTESQDLVLNPSHLLSKKMVENSWFSTKILYPRNKNLQQIYLTHYKPHSNFVIIKSKSVRLYPTKNQIKLFKFWLNCSRYVYNWTIDFLKSCIDFNPSWMDVKKYATKLLPKWTKAIPFQIKGIAIRDAHKAFWAAKCCPKFRSRKTPLQSCYIPKSAISDKGIYSRISGKGLIFKETLPEQPMDSRLVSQYNQWFLSVPSKHTTRVAENQGHGIVALDPGIRAFQTFYSETSAGHLGQYDIGRISRLCYYLDNLISRTSKVFGNKKKRMKLAQGRIRLKIQNLVKELHHKAAYFLVNNFDVILLPTFGVKRMSKKSSKLRSKTVRQMLTWSHYKFKMFLKNKALEFGKTVTEVCEAYTSKTESWSGKIVNIGGSKVIGSGKIKLDRDLNGARNIFVRSLGDSPSLKKLISLACIVNDC